VVRPFLAGLMHRGAPWGTATEHACNYFAWVAGAGAAAVPQGKTCTLARSLL